MLKKNLHFFTRCTAFLLLFIGCACICSCRQANESYLSFLSGEIEMQCSIVNQSKACIGASITKKNGSITVAFTSPSALSGTTLTITAESSSLSRNGIPLSDSAIPPLWLTVYDMLSPEKSIVSVRSSGDLTEIHTRSEAGEFIYRTDKNGKLTGISSELFELTVREN